MLKDLAPVSLLTSAPLLIVGKNALPVNDGKELIAWLKANPDTGVGRDRRRRQRRARVRDLLQDRHTRFQWCPTRRGARDAGPDRRPDGPDVCRGVADADLLAQREDKAFGVMAKARWPALPDVPTTDEVGAPGMYISFWHGLWVPKGTPKDVIAKLNDAVVEALADPAVRNGSPTSARLSRPRDQQTPERSPLHKAEIEKWWPIIKAANIKVEAH